MRKTREELPKGPVSASTEASNGLTGIPQSIHCPATQTDVEAEHDEHSEIAIEHFFDTLAKVALAVAAREVEEDKERNG